MMRCALTLLMAVCVFATPSAQSADPATRNQAAARAMNEGRFDEAVALLEPAVAARPADVETRWMLAGAYTASGRRMDAVAALRKFTELAPTRPSGWYALGQAYNDIKQDALSTFRDQSEDAPWRQLLGADAMLTTGPLTDAFFLYRDTLQQLPSMVSIHDAVARIYEQTGHADWAARERVSGALSAADCAKRQALCQFRAGQYASALNAALAQPDAESRYWRARTASELALAAFKHLDGLADSVERRSVSAARARAEERYIDAVADLKAAIVLAPGNPALTSDLASSYFAARDFEQAIATLSPLLQAHPDDVGLLQMMGSSLLQLRRIDEALPVLRHAVDRDPTDPRPRLALGWAYLQNGDFAAAIPLIEGQLAADQDGSLHAQLARAYQGLGQRDKADVLLLRSGELQLAAQERSAAASQRTITPPK